MLYKVRVKKTPKAQSGLEVKMRAGLGFNANQLSWPVMAGEFSEPQITTRHTLEEVERDEANLEAEVGETAVTSLNGDGVPEHYKIGGKRHYAGGTPLNLPDHSYIFSRDNSMKIKDPEILAQFGITKFPRSGVTPADIAKKYDINKYKKVLLDKNSDDLARSTAEMMISNYMLKLGKLALLQESTKGFPEGIPLISMPYLESMGMDPKEILPSEQEIPGLVEGQQEVPDADEDVEAQYGKELRRFQLAPSQTGNDYKYSVLPMPNQYGKPVWRKINKTTGQVDIMDPGFVVQGKTASDYLASKSNTPATTNKPAANNNPASSRKTSSMSSVDKVVPPLTYNMGAVTADYDPRLSEQSNKKYNALVKAINSSDDVRKAIVEQYKVVLSRKDKTVKISDDDIKKLSAMTPEDIIADFLQYQKQNWALADADKENVARGGKSIYEKPDKGGVGLDTRLNFGNKVHRQLLKNRGFETDGIQEGIDIAGVQTTSQALLEVMNMPEFKETFKGFGIRRKGTHTDPGNYVDPKTGLVTHTSAVDSYAGDDTDAFLVDWMGDEEKPQAEPEPEPEKDPLKKPEIQEEEEDNRAPWWIQDVIKTSGAFMDMMRVKKYMPWQAVPSVDFIEPTFYSPERELAASAEQVAIGAEGLAQFSGPQAYNARFSQMAGKAAANAADILGRYNNMNVGVANEAEKFNVDIYNKYADDRAADATALFDKVTVANQEYDNSKNKARQELRQSYIDALTNKAQAYNYNQIYPDWAIDPRRAGMLNRKPSRDIDPRDYRPEDEVKNITDWMKQRPVYISEEDWLDQYNISRNPNYNPRSRNRNDGTTNPNTNPNYTNQPYYPDPNNPYYPPVMSYPGMNTTKK